MSDRFPDNSIGDQSPGTNIFEATLGQEGFDSAIFFTLGYFRDGTEISFAGLLLSLEGFGVTSEKLEEYINALLGDEEIRIAQGRVTDIKNSTFRITSNGQRKLGSLRKLAIGAMVEILSAMDDEDDSIGDLPVEPSGAPSPTPAPATA